MILRSAPASPFGRKVKIAASLLGLADRIETVDADTNSAGDPLRRDNPLGKIPTLVLDDGSTLFDSRVIVEYLDHRAGSGKLIPNEAGPRFAALRLQALGDGICDAALAVVYEGRWREAATHNAPWLDHQHGKIARALDHLEPEPPAGPPTVGTVALACALGYLDLRLDGRWRDGHPALVAWLESFAATVPAFGATAVAPG